MTIDEIRTLLRAGTPRSPPGNLELGGRRWEDIPCEGFNGPCDKRPSALIPAMTAYEEPELNEDHRFCHSCAEEYIAHWQSMWDDYYSGRM